MINRYKHSKTTWLEVVSPTAEEVRELIEECNIPREYAGDLTAPTPKTEVFAKKGFFKVTLDFPIVKRTDINHPHEIKFLVTKDHLVTIRFEEIEAVHRFTKEYEVLCLLGSKSKTQITPDSLCITMINYLYASLHVKLDYLENRLKDIEEGIFAGHEREMVFELSQISRRLITFRQTIGAHDNALDGMPNALQVAFGKVDVNRIEELEHHYHSLKRHLNALTSVLTDLKDTNSALLFTKQNEVMKLFTILAFITFPLTLFTSMFGMNTVATPILGHQFDFWIILSIMVVVSITFFGFFKYKKWI